jgi:hypothetical protein
MRELRLRRRKRADLAGRPVLSRRRRRSPGAGHRSSGPGSRVVKLLVVRARARRLGAAIRRREDLVARREVEAPERIFDRGDRRAHDAHRHAQMKADLVCRMRVGRIGDGDVDRPCDRVAPNGEREQATAEAAW